MGDRKISEPIAVDTASMASRTKPSNYPEPFFSRMAKREKRVLGDIFGLSNFGVKMTKASIRTMISKPQLEPAVNGCSPVKTASPTNLKPLN